MISNTDAWQVLGMLGLLAALAAVISTTIIVVLRPFLVRHALARPTARSSHQEPTPQGGGIAVIGATIIVVAGAIAFTPGASANPLWLGIVFATVIGLAVVGATDDVRPLEALPRLLLQAAAVAVVIAALPPEMRIIHALPWWFERACILIAGVWFVNLVNFMDGIDWMMVAEIVPITSGLLVFGLLGELPWDAMVVSAALLGAIIGFAPFNRPVARLFLGDVGSLPIGLLIGWMLVLLAGAGHLAAALLLPLYFLADATVTLVRRLYNGEPVMQAHRSHFYQRARDRGLIVYQIVGRVFAANVILVGLALLTLLSASIYIHIAALVAGGAVLGALLWNFNSAYRSA